MGAHRCFPCLFFLLLLNHPSTHSALAQLSPQAARGNSWHRALLAVEVPMCQGLLLHLCTEMSTPGTAASQNTEQSCPRWKTHALASTRARKARANRNNAILSPLLEKLQAMLLFPLLLWLQLQATLNTLRKVSNPFISLSNQYFVLLQHSRSNLTHFQSLYKREAAPGWGFCSLCSLHSRVPTAYGPVWWAKERVQSQSLIGNTYGL